MKQGVDREFIKKMLNLEDWDVYDRAIKVMNSVLESEKKHGGSVERIRKFQRVQMKQQGIPKEVIDFLVPEDVEDRIRSPMSGEDYIEIVLDRIDNFIEELKYDVEIVVIDSMPALVGYLKLEERGIRNALNLLFGTFRTYENTYVLMIAEEAKQFEDINEMAEGLADGVIKLELDKRREVHNH